MSDSKQGPSTGKRVLDVLFSFEKSPKVTIQEISEMVGIPLPTTHRYIALLRDMGLVEEDSGNRYRLTMRVVSLAQSARKATPIVEVADPYMRELGDELGETVLLVQSVDGLPICTHRIESERRLRLSFEVGHRMPPLRGASAHLLLAARPKRERTEYVERLIAQGEQPPASGIAEFLRKVEEDGNRGWTSSHAEIEEGIWTTAAAIRTQGRVIATISVPCPAFRMTPEVQDRITRATVTAAEKISSALGE